MKKKGLNILPAKEVNITPKNSGRVYFEVHLRLSNCPKLRLSTKNCSYLWYARKRNFIL
jgi:hypothetical protein